MLSDGSCAIIEAIQVEPLSTPETTYNFEVADYHTYYVSGSKVLVHNMCAKNNEGFELANRGQSSSGRRTPNNLKEKLAMEQAMSNPLAGKQLSVKMTDPRWLGSEGWVKMQQTFTFFDGTSTTIHYVLNKSLGLIDDFKFVFPL